MEILRQRELSRNILNIAFAGTPELATTILKAILENSKHQVKMVLTQPDRPSGRGRKLTASAVKTLALEHGIRINCATRQSRRDGSDDSCRLWNVVA